jgi:glycosyltransferase involved in cell wall biosynthesis
MKRPLVSVIVPVYNGEHFIAEALNSLFAQDYRPIEVIVVDDGSIDRTADIVRTYKDVHYIYQSNQGAASARNTGIAVAQGEFITFLDADDIWIRNKLSAQVEHLLSNHNIGYVVTGIRNFIDPRFKPPPWLLKNLLQDQVGFGTLLARRDVFNRVGVFDTNYRVAEDYDWFIRAKDSGISKAILPNVLVMRRIHDRNISAQRKRAISEVLSSLINSINRKKT